MPILLSNGLIETINIQPTSQTTMNLLAQHKSSHAIKNSHPTSKSQASLNQNKSLARLMPIQLMPILLSNGLIETINLQSTSQTTMNLLPQHKSSHAIKNSHPTSKSQASLNALIPIES
ncbi:hypothetical protein CEXT_380891 [Caerostris extrusa]|uniref:Uncharacterized protein n=1 Tax=Caerostris extrusa TaxID=172846 RepID=A0AAV4W0S2_CAEEX|nr:hypothetical protein CEXT_380891 [Caerostris extrusa]